MQPLLIAINAYKSWSELGPQDLSPSNFICKSLQKTGVFGPFPTP